MEPIASCHHFLEIFSLELYQLDKEVEILRYPIDIEKSKEIFQNQFVWSQGCHYLLHRIANSYT